jgi:hypothetical protein
VANRIQGILHLEGPNTKDFERAEANGSFQWPVRRKSDSLTQGPPAKQCASTGQMRRLKIDSLDQNRF